MFEGVVVVLEALVGAAEALDELGAVVASAWAGIMVGTIRRTILMMIRIYNL